MKARFARRPSGLALWLVLASLAIVALAAYAREHASHPSPVYIAVRAYSARPPSARLSFQPGPMAALPGEAPELCSTPVCSIEDRAGALVAAPPRPALLRHEYPRGPPRA